MNTFYGYFEDAGSIPAVDPGLDVPCPICGEVLRTSPRKTISMMIDGDVRSYFYRTHATCYDALDEGQKYDLDHRVLAPMYQAWSNHQ